jgi:hypothetical protein
VRPQFSEEELANLTVAIVAINGANRNIDFPPPFPVVIARWRGGQPSKDIPCRQTHS